jgi:hypothetical protein
MSCRKVVCQECATTWDGVNHCRPCLSQKRAATEQRGSALRWVTWGVGASLLFFATSRVLAWAGGLWARLWS